MSTVDVREEQAREEEILDEVRRFKETLSFILMDKALESGNPTKDDEFKYVLSSILKSLDVEYVDDPSLLMATDGKKLYVGPIYRTLKTSVLNKKGERYWTRLLTSIITHEALHVMFAHIQRAELVEDKELYNIIADLYVNTLIKEKLGFNLPNTFVTAESFARFICRAHPEHCDKVDVLNRLPEMLDTLTVESIYNLLTSVLPPQVIRSVKDEFGSGYFFGHDMEMPISGRVPPRKTRKEKRAGEGEGEGQCRDLRAGKGKSGKEGEGKEHEEQGKTGRGKGEGREKPGEKKGEEGTGITDEQLKEMARRGAEYLSKLKKIRDEINEALERIHRSMGEYRAIQSMRRRQRGEVGKEAGVGPTGAIERYAEYKIMRVKAIPIELQFLREVSDALEEPQTTYERFDEEAYWLPAEEQEEKKEVLALVDTSPSIQHHAKHLFVSLVVIASRTYDIIYNVVFFGTDVLQETIIKGDEVKVKAPLGLGTTWDEGILKKIREAERRGIRLIQVLSDFEIIISNDVREEIKHTSRQWAVKYRATR